MDGVEAAGGLVTGGLIAKVLSRRESRKVKAERHPGFCTDCGAQVSGKFCAECGQPTHVHRSLLHLIEELLHGVMHFDARVWRTLPLLAFNPGRLTREWVQGRRTRYVSPLALFLFTVFLLFFIYSFWGGDLIRGTPLDVRIAEARTEQATARRDSDAALAALLTAERAGGTDPEALTEARTAFAEAADELGEETAALDRLLALQIAGPRADGYEVGSVQAEIADAVRADNVEVKGDDKWVAKVRQKLANPELLIYKLQQTIYKFAFLLVPLSIPFVALLFLWKRGFTLYDHGVFVLYSLTAMTILFVLVGFAATGPGWVGATAATVATFGVPAHMFAQLKGTYALSWFSAAWRTVMLLIFCTIVISIFLILIVLLGLV